MKPLRILVDENIPEAESTFGRHGRLQRVDGRNLATAAVRHADALIVRSVTRVSGELLDGSRVRFVGSATIGTDHLDIPYLRSRSIAWAAAPGCNADAAAQYTLAMMLLASRRLQFELRKRSIGVIGCGNVGSRVVALLDAIGASPAAVCDPPRAAAERDFLERGDIADCDLLTLHVPLSTEGRWPTRKLVDQAFLERLSPASVLVNTSRGAVIEDAALSDWLVAGRGHAALDVWAGEPAVPADRIAQAVVATPHVAGYSLDGKLRGTLQVYRAFRLWLGLDPEVPDLLAELEDRDLPANAATSVADAVLAACPVERDDAALRAVSARGSRDPGAAFDDLRRSYPARRDFAGWRLPGPLAPSLENALRGLGFR